MHLPVLRLPLKLILKRTSVARKRNLLIMYTILRHINVFFYSNINVLIERILVFFSNIPNMNSVYKHTGDENIIGAPQIQNNYGAIQLLFFPILRKQY